MDIATEIKEQQPLIVQQARHVHTITDRFSRANTYLVNDEEFCFVVDPGSMLNTQLTLHYLQRFLHRTPNDIDLIVLTHLHPDHTDGVEALRKACKAPVAASNVAQQLVQSWQDGNRQEILEQARHEPFRRAYAQPVSFARCPASSRPLSPTL